LNGDELLPARRVLITGGAGFLGSHLADRFISEGVRVRLFDLEDCPRWAAERAIDYIQGDVLEPDALASALEGVDSVVHAAFASPRQSRKEISSVNVEGTRNLCASALAQGVNRIILISSTIVLKPHRVHPLFPNSPLSHLDLYRSSRVHAEKIVTDYGGRGLSVAVVRPKTFVGPGRVSAFAIVFDLIRRGKPVPVFGNGQNRYQLLDIRDLADGIRLLEAAESEGVFFFGARDLRSIREDFQELLDHALTGARLRFVPNWIARAALRGIEFANMVPLSEWYYLSANGEDSVVDISRAERDLGWQPVRSNAQTLREAFDWYVERVTSSGTARATHPVPIAHRILKKLAWFIQ
jgi:nucleoside-diphosphate-sugar epimerase